MPNWLPGYYKNGIFYGNEFEDYFNEISKSHKLEEERTQLVIQSCHIDKLQNCHLNARIKALHVYDSTICLFDVYFSDYNCGYILFQNVICIKVNIKEDTYFDEIEICRSQLGDIYVPYKASTTSINIDFTTINCVKFLRGNLYEDEISNIYLGLADFGYGDRWNRFRLFDSIQNALLE